MNGLDNKLTIAFDIDNTLIVHEGIIPNMIVKVQATLLNRKDRENKRIVESEWNNDGSFERTPDENDEDCVKCIRKLAEAGHKVVVLTSRPGVAPVKYLTEWSLDKHGIPYHILVLNCQNKADYCRENDVDVLIDDNEVTCQKVASKNPEMLVVHFAESKEEQPSTYQTSNNWSDIYDKISNKMNLALPTAL